MLWRLFFSPPYLRMEILLTKAWFFCFGFFNYSLLPEKRHLIKVCRICFPLLFVRILLCG